MSDFAAWLRDRYETAGVPAPDGLVDMWAWPNHSLDAEEVRIIADDTGATPAEVEHAWRRYNTERAAAEAFVDQNGLTDLEAHLTMKIIGHHVPDETND